MNDIIFTQRSKKIAFWIVFIIGYVIISISQSRYVFNEVSYNGMFDDSAMDYIIFQVFAKPFIAILAPLIIGVFILDKLQFMSTNNVIVRKNSRNNLFNECLSQILIYSLIFIIVSVLITAVLQIIQGDIICNYDQQGSCFYFYTNNILNLYQKICLVIKIVLYGYLEILTRVLICILTYVLTIKEWKAFLAEVIIAFLLPIRLIDYIINGKNYSVSRVYQFYIHDIYWANMIMVALLCLLLIMITRYFMCKRDFLK